MLQLFDAYMVDLDSIVFNDDEKLYRVITNIRADAVFFVDYRNACDETLLEDARLALWRKFGRRARCYGVEDCTELIDAGYGSECGTNA